ncbi:hypothetical protein ACFROC_00060 [Nocardia tengchongensis]|uniref:hypothetical protein n=1 Tax=Nocardia tengchongensis TaxID=2055889 RepID=UPI0036C846BD
MIDAVAQLLLRLDIHGRIKVVSKSGYRDCWHQAAMGTRFCGATMWKHAPSRHRLEKASRILEDGDLWAVATSDLFWDRIVEISDLGEQEVYGCLVAGMPSLVAQGTFVLGLPAVCCRMV